MKDLIAIIIAIVLAVVFKDTLTGLITTGLAFMFAVIILFKSIVWVLKK